LLVKLRRGAGLMAAAWPRSPWVAQVPVGDVLPGALCQSALLTDRALLGMADTGYDPFQDCEHRLFMCPKPLTVRSFGHVLERSLGARAQPINHAVN
jgi:hypothetical protein